MDCRQNSVTINWCNTRQLGDSNGNHIWSKRFGDWEAFDFGFDVSIGSGLVYAMGNFDGTVDFGGGPLVSAGNTDYYLAAYDATGASAERSKLSWADASNVRAVPCKATVYILEPMLSQLGDRSRAHCTM